LSGIADRRAPRTRRVRRLWPALLVLCCVLGLASLGTWQLHRKQWKEDLIARIAARATAPPVPLAEATALLAGGADIDYLHVRLTGRLRNDAERYLYAPGASGPGWHVYTPLELVDGVTVWVNRGFVPDARKAPQTRRLGLLSGAVTITGLVRAARARGAFQPKNQPATNTWYWPDAGELSASLPAHGHSLPFTIDADRLPEVPGGLPQGGVTRLGLDNRHLAYALTWYALAVTLLGVFLAAALGRRPPVCSEEPQVEAAATAASSPCLERGAERGENTG
jgi:surfeit locus 1 family protein